MSKIECKVYVTNLGKYNEGELVGEWLILPATEEEIQQCFKNIGLDEEYEEYCITDVESNVDLEIGMYSNLVEYSDLINDMIEAENDAGLWNALAETEGNDYQHLLYLTDRVREGYYQFYDGITAEQYEEQTIEDLYYSELQALGWLQNYITIDYEGLARYDDRIYETETGVLVYC